MSKPAFSRGEPDARRLQLIHATARVLARGGAAGTSVRAIALEAGVSPGLVGHYFVGIDALIAETYASVGAQVGMALAAATEAAGSDPRSRLDAYVEASFDPPIADPELLATWLVFWGLVRSRPAIDRLHADLYGAYRRDLATLLAECGVAPADIRLAAIGITAMVDGLWLELCLAPDAFDAADARAIARRQLDAIIS